MHRTWDACVMAPTKAFVDTSPTGSTQLVSHCVRGKSICSLVSSLELGAFVPANMHRIAARTGCNCTSCVPAR